MKLLFSEAKPDYSRYVFPYAIWALPEPGETPSDLFNAGFLPASRDLDRFYLCRHVRIPLGSYRASSENRRILRKGQDIQFQIAPRARFEFTPERRRAWKKYADMKFGKDVMSFRRLDNLMASALVTHLMTFSDSATGQEVGNVMLFLEWPATAYYYYAFYHLEYRQRNLGMFMMTAAVEQLAAQGYQHLYLGTVYSQNALYKTQFSGVQFFIGFEWSSDLRALKHLLQRDALTQNQHLLESEDFLQQFYPDGVKKLATTAGFGIDDR